LALGGSVIIVTAALMLTGRSSPTPPHDPGSGSPGGAAPLAAPASRAVAEPAPPEAPDGDVAPATGGAPIIPRTPAVPRAARKKYSVLVTSDPPGAVAWVPGERAARGRTPLDVQLNSPRPRRLKLVAPGFKTATVTVSGAQTGARVHTRLTPALGARRPPAGRRQGQPPLDPYRKYRKARD
jgi:hypothetical protein